MVYFLIFAINIFFSLNISWASNFILNFFIVVLSSIETPNKLPTEFLHQEKILSSNQATTKTVREENITKVYGTIEYI